MVVVVVVVVLQQQLFGHSDIFSFLFSECVCLFIFQCSYDPAKRITCSEAMEHPFFHELLRGGGENASSTEGTASGEKK